VKRALAAIAWAVALAAVAAGVPEGWQRLKINDKKKPTVYEAQTEGGRPIVHARAQASASGLYRKAGFELAERPAMRWSWKVGGLIPGADNSTALRPRVLRLAGSFFAAAAFFGAALAFFSAASTSARLSLRRTILAAIDKPGLEVSGGKEL